MASFASVPAKGAPPRPPDKGSFPLDHFGECSAVKRRYMECLKEHAMQTEACRNLAKSYLQCRMDTNLMAREELSKLGYRDAPDANAAEKPHATEQRDRLEWALLRG